MPDIESECLYVETGAGEWLQNPITGMPHWIPLRDTDSPCDGICGPEDLTDWRETAARGISDLESAYGDAYPAVNQLRSEFDEIVIPPMSISYGEFIEKYISLAQRACSIGMQYGPAEEDDQCDPTEAPPYGYVCVDRAGQWVLERDPNVKLDPIPSRPPNVPPPAPTKSSNGKAGQDVIMLLLAAGVAWGIVAMKKRGN